MRKLRVNRNINTANYGKFKVYKYEYVDGIQYWKVIKDLRDAFPQFI